VGGGGCIKLAVPTSEIFRRSGQDSSFYVQYARFYSFLLRKNANSLQEFCGVGLLLYYGCCFNNVDAVAAAVLLLLLRLLMLLLLLTWSFCLVCLQLCCCCSFSRVRSPYNLTYLPHGSAWYCLCSMQYAFTAVDSSCTTVYWLLLFSWSWPVMHVLWLLIALANVPATCVFS
jgi:hypothetical protein